MIFLFLFHFSMKIISANRKVPDGTPRFAASHLGLFCLSMSHKKDARVKEVSAVDIGYITQTCPCNILQYFKAVKMIIFR